MRDENAAMTRCFPVIASIEDATWYTRVKSP